LSVLFKILEFESIVETIHTWFWIWNFENSKKLLKKQVSKILMMKIY